MQIFADDFDFAGNTIIGGGGEFNITAGGATGTDERGGRVNISSGAATGDQFSDIIFSVAVGGVSGTTVNDPQRMLYMSAGGISFYPNPDMNQNFGVQRVESDGAGLQLQISAGSAMGTDQQGGTLRLQGGKSTGEGEGGSIEFYSTYGTVSGTGDAPSAKLAILDAPSNTFTVLRQDDSFAPKFALQRARVANANLQTNDTVGVFNFWARAGGTEELIGQIRGLYLGDGTTTEGQVQIATNDGAGLNNLLEISPYGFMLFNGNEVLTTQNSMHKIVVVDNIDATTTGETTLYTVPTGKNLVVTLMVIRSTAFVSGGKTVNGFGTIGGNNPSYDDWSFTNTQEPAVSAVDQCFVFNNQESLKGGNIGSVPVPVYPAGTDFKFNMTGASDATTEVWSIDVFGYFA
jgi:hypothetical protein